jgi:hypothetical protein
VPLSLQASVSSGVIATKMGIKAYHKNSVEIIPPLHKVQSPFVIGQVAVFFFNTFVLCGTCIFKPSQPSFSSFTTQASNMFAKLAGLFTISALVAGVSAIPLVPRTQSLDSWGGYESLKGFDDFYGVDNYAGHYKDIQVIKKPELVCHTQQVEIIQQRLIVLQEFAKKIITETICEVETQTFVFEQFYGSLGHFGDDIRRSSGNSVGYDEGIVSHFPSLVNDNYEHLGFSGADLGKHYVSPSGNNWDDSTSFKSVNSAYYTAHSLY